MERYLLGIDVGTTGTKTLLFSEQGVLLGHAYRPYGMQTPKVGWSEQNAEDWWRAVTEAVREVCRDPEVASHVVAISLSLQGGTLAAVDEAFRPVRPAMVWNDARCTAERDAFLRETGGAEKMYQKTGWHLGTGLLPLEIRWMKDHEPEPFEKIAWFLSVPDYISAKMTGVPAVDLSDVGINQLGDIRRGVYDGELLRFAGITEAKLPKIVRSGDIMSCRRA